MKRLFFLVLWVAAQSYGLDRNAFTFTNYDLNVRLEPEQARMGVRGKLSLRNDSKDPQTAVALQISASLAWRSIQSKGKNVVFVSQPYTSDIDHTGGLSEAIVTLESAVPPGGSLELDVGYEGVVVADATRLTRMGVPKESALHTDWDQIGAANTVVRGLGYVTWYPVAIDAASLSDGNSVFDAVHAWKVRHAASSMKASLCTLSSHEEDPQPTWMNDAGTNNVLAGGCSEHSFAPMGFTVPVIAAGSYSAAKGESGETRFYSADKTNAEVYQAASDRAMPFVSEWFGAPKRKVIVVELPDAKAGPFESGGMLFTPLNFDAASAENIAVHQLVHAAILSPRPWIYEGLAHFAQALYVERRRGRESALEFMNSFRQQIVDREKAIADGHDPDSASEQSLINTSSEEFIRSKAMYVWWMLRDMTSDTVFKAAVAAYKPEQDKRASYVQELFATQSKRDLEWFFDDWVYRDRGLPEFRIMTLYPRKSMNDTYLVAVTVENTGNVGAEVRVMSPQPGGVVMEKMEIKAKSQGTLRLALGTAPVEATVNDGSVPEIDFANDTTKVSAEQK